MGTYLKKKKKYFNLPFIVLILNHKLARLRVQVLELI